MPITHPQFGAVDDVIGMGMPMRMSNATIGLDQPAPTLGQHNDEVYGTMLGYSAERVADLRARRVI